jgi:citrate lyase subunit beta/citryl-CoA lyase
MLHDRAWLFCPGDRPDWFAKAARVSRVVIVDLEDAVGDDEKENARSNLARAKDILGDALVVRVNNANSPWFAGDIEEVRRIAPTAVMLPKVSNDSDLEACADLNVVAICESASGLLNAADIAQVPHCRGLMWGGEDLIADLGGSTSRDNEGHYWPIVQQLRSQVLLAAAAAQIIAIDAVYMNLNDQPGLLQETAEAVAIGFTAKACIHPRHVATIQLAFQPTSDELDWAIGLFELLDKSGGAVATYRGRMVDQPMLRHAKNILRRSDSQKALHLVKQDAK